MMYLVIMSVWTFMFFLMCIYMCIEIKQTKNLQDWNNKTALQVNGNKARVDALEDKVKALEEKLKEKEDGIKTV